MSITPAPRFWTGEAVLDHALEVAGFEAEDLRRAMLVTREALTATVKGEPDYPTRLRASENIFGWVGLRGSRKPVEGERGPVTINVAIISSELGHASQADGVAIRFSGGAGDGA
jgi:hypothetical protein